MRRSALALEIRFTGAGEAAFRDWLGAGLAFVDQGDGDLGARMARAAAPWPRIFIGSDCPDMTAGHLRAAADALDTHDIVIGPAEDGGYWLLGLSRPLPFLFETMPWGTDAVFAETLTRLKAHGIAPALLDRLADCDRPEDLARWPELAA